MVRSRDAHQLKKLERALDQQTDLPMFTVLDVSLGRAPGVAEA